MLERLPAASALVLAGAAFAADAARMPAPPGEVPAAATSSTPAWQPWSDQVFAQAKREKRFVLLDLEAVWCHWCHVMEETTYHDRKVAASIGRHYIAVKADQDARICRDGTMNTGGRRR